MATTERAWKTRERAINEHFANALRAELSRARVKPAAAGQAAGFSQQSMSKWLNASASNDGPVLTVGRLVAICRANGIDPEKVIAEGNASAREAGLLEPNWMSDPTDNVYPIAALDREINEEFEGR